MMRISLRDPKLRVLLAGLDAGEVPAAVLADFLDDRGDERAVAVRFAPSVAMAHLVLRPKNHNRRCPAWFINHIRETAALKQRLEASPEPRRGLIATLDIMLGEAYYLAALGPDPKLPRQNWSLVMVPQDERALRQPRRPPWKKRA